MIICQSNSRLVGYARVSTTDQELCLQIDALRQHGVQKEHLFCDKISGAKEDRPGLAAGNETLRKGDTLVVWRLDRLVRSMRHLVNMIEELKERGIGFRSISDAMIDTTSESGELVLNIFFQFNFRDLPGNTQWQHVFGVSLLSQ
jgi:DNA invertase Pin-like site-specific DNA recombinase